MQTVVDTDADVVLFNRERFESGLYPLTPTPTVTRAQRVITTVESHPVVKTASKARSIGHAVVDVDARLHYLVGSVVIFTRAASGEIDVVSVAITGVVLVMLVTHYAVVRYVTRH